METGKTSPQLDTVLKVLASLGKTLAVVPLEQKKSLIERSWKTLTNLTVIVPQVYNIEKSTYSLF